MSKVFVVDVAKCNGCHNCQVACKDEHCNQEWMPYAQAQPLTGQFWMKVDEKERGQVPVVRLAYIPHTCSHCDNPACAKAAPDAVYKRDDGLVIIDPEKAKGKKEIVDSCPSHAIFWNEELDLPQKCTGCAHLLDNGWEVPRCVDACPTDALRYVEESEVDLSEAITLPELEGQGPHVYYLNYPKRFVAGLACDPEIDEVLIGADVTLIASNGTEQSMKTDDFGDFKFDQVEADAYTVRIEMAGYETVEVKADATEKDLFIGDIALKPAVDRSELPDAAERAREERKTAEAKWKDALDNLGIKFSQNVNFAVICPECGKKMNTSTDTTMLRCQFCKADLTEEVEKKKAELGL